MSIGNLILDVNIATLSYLIHYESLLQIETILLQNATVTTKCDIIYDMIWSIYLTLQQKQQHTYYEKIWLIKAKLKKKTQTANQNKKKKEKEQTKTKETKNRTNKQTNKKHLRSLQSVKICKCE